MEPIDINDGPPMPLQFVLVHLKPGPGWLKGIMRTNSSWEAMFSDGMMPVKEPFAVTHWMHLPEDPTTT